MFFVDGLKKIKDIIETFHQDLISNPITAVFFGSFLAHFIDFTGNLWGLFFKMMLFFMCLLLLWTVWEYLSDKYLRKSQNIFEYVGERCSHYGLFWILPLSFSFIFFPDINLLAGIAIVSSYKFIAVPFVVIIKSIRPSRKRYFLYLQKIRKKNEKQRQTEIKRQWHPRSNKTRHRIYPVSYGYQRYICD